MITAARSTLRPLRFSGDVRDIILSRDTEAEITNNKPAAVDSAASSSHH
jgi:hypothetical protein